MVRGAVKGVIICFGSIWAIVPEIWDSMGNVHLSQMIEDFCDIFALLISKSWDGCKTVKSQACTQCNLPLLPIFHFEIFQSSLLLTLNLIVVWSSHLGVFCPGICQVPRLRQLLSLSTLLSTLICLASIQYNGWGKPFGLKYWSCKMWYYVILQRKTSSIKNI